MSGAKRSGARPPWPAEALIARSLDPEDREFGLGDLAQEYEERRENRGGFLAGGWYWLQVARTWLEGVRGGPDPGGAAEPPGGPELESGTAGGRAGLLDAASRDVGHAFRSFARAPGFTAAAVTTLALGIGATTGGFSLADAHLFRPIPGVERPGELARALGCLPTSGPGSCMVVGLTYPNLEDIALRTERISGLAGYASAAGVAEVAAEDGALRNLDPLYVTASYFDVLGVQPVLGRTFGVEEDDPGNGAPVAVISHRLWRSSFNGTRDVVGGNLRVNGRRLTVIGVMPRGFHGTEEGPRDVWLPGSIMRWINRWPGDPADRESGTDYHYLIVRRSPGASWEQVEAELDSFGAWLAGEHPEANARLEDLTFRVSPDLRSPAPQAATMVVALLAVVGLILLIACSNVAGLLVIRGLRRRGELAVRKALGASRWRLLRQQLVDAVLLWLAGGAAGGLLCFVVVRTVERRAPLSDLVLPMDLRVLGFTAALSLAVGLLFGALPALGAARVDAARWLGQASPASTGRRRWVRTGLSIGQLGAMLTLVVGALLMARTLNALYHVDLGFAPDDVTVFELRLGEQRFDDATRVQYYREMADRLRAHGQVVQASSARWIPFDGSGISTSASVAGDDDDGAVEARLNFVGESYFEVLQTPLVAGRTFTRGEVFASAPSQVVILSETLARRLFGDADPLGKLVEFPGGRDPERRYRVVGIVGDVRFSPRQLTGDVDPMAYEPHGSLGGDVPPAASFLVRARPGAEDVGRLIRSTAATLDPDLLVLGLQSHSDLVDRFYLGRRMIASLTAAMSVLAAFLAAIGLYGVVGVAATERVREFGIRVALGADRGAMVRLVTGEALGIVVPGLIAGLLGAFALGHLIQGFLYRVSPLDPVSWFLATLLLGVVTAVAIAAPVHRAAAVDPVEVLRAS